MNQQEALIRYNKAKSDLSNGIEQMKIFGKELGKNIEEIENDVFKTAEID